MKFNNTNIRFVASASVLFAANSSGLVAQETHSDYNQIKQSAVSLGLRGNLHNPTSPFVEKVASPRSKYFQDQVELIRIKITQNKNLQETASLCQLAFFTLWPGEASGTMFVRQLDSDSPWHVSGSIPSGPLLAWNVVHHPLESGAPTFINRSIAFYLLERICNDDLVRLSPQLIRDSFFIIDYKKQTAEFRWWIRELLVDNPTEHASKKIVHILGESLILDPEAAAPRDLFKVAISICPPDLNPLYFPPDNPASAVGYIELFEMLGRPIEERPEHVVKLILPKPSYISPLREQNQKDHAFRPIPRYIPPAGILPPLAPIYDGRRPIEYLSIASSPEQTGLAVFAGLFAACGEWSTATAACKLLDNEILYDTNIIRMGEIARLSCDATVGTDILSFGMLFAGKATAADARLIHINNKAIHKTIRIRSKEFVLASFREKNRSSEWRPYATALLGLGEYVSAMQAVGSDAMRLQMEQRLATKTADLSQEVIKYLEIQSGLQNMPQEISDLDLFKLHLDISQDALWEHRVIYNAAKQKLGDALPGDLVQVDTLLGMP